MIHIVTAKDRQRFVTALQALTVAALLLLTLVDVERDISDAELWLARAVPVVMAVGMVACMVARRHVRLTALDAVVMAWWTVEAVMCYVGVGVFTPRAFLAFSEAVFLYAGLRLLFAAGRLSGALVAAGIMACCLYESVLGIYQLFTDTSRHGIYPLTGTFLNPGPYSAYLAVGVAVAVCCIQVQSGVRVPSGFSGRGKEACAISSSLHRRGGYLPYGGSGGECGRGLPLTFYSLFLILPLAVLPVTWSRAAWVSVAVVSACIYWRRLARYKYVIAAAVVAGCVSAYLLKQGSADGRVVMWLGALRAIAADPWTGAGIGGFGGAYAGGVASLFAGGGAQGLLQAANVTDNAYNELLTVGVEQGLPGMAAFAAVTVMALMRLRRSCRPLMCGLLALVAFSMFSYPLHCQPYRILFVLLCAWAAAPSGSPVRRSETCGIAVSQRRDGVGETCAPSHGKAGWSRALPFCFFTFLLFIASLVARAETERRVAAADDYRLMAGVDATYLIEDYYELLPLMDDNEHFMFGFGKALHDLGRHNDSNAMLRRGAELSADPMFLVVMGNNYRAMGLTAEAERCYSRAFGMMPNRIYPLYRLMKLYEEQGRRAECLRMARRVAAFDEKVESEATRDMKSEAEEMIKIGNSAK